MPKWQKKVLLHSKSTSHSPTPTNDPDLVGGSTDKEVLLLFLSLYNLLEAGLSKFYQQRTTTFNLNYLTV